MKTIIHPLLHEGAELTLARILHKDQSIWWPGIKYTNVPHMMKSIEKEHDLFDATAESTERNKIRKAKIFLSARKERKKNPSLTPHCVVLLLAMDAVKFFSVEECDVDLCSFFVHAFDHFQGMEEQEDVVRFKAYEEATNILEHMEYTDATKENALSCCSVLSPSSCALIPEPTSSPVRSLRPRPSLRVVPTTPSSSHQTNNNNMKDTPPNKNHLHILVPCVQHSSMSSPAPPSPPKIHLRDGIWLDFLSKLVAYKNNYGDLNVPNPWKQDPALCEWVKLQRTEYALHKEGMESYLTKEKIQILTSIGFQWRMKEEEEPACARRIRDNRHALSKCCVKSGHKSTGVQHGQTSPGQSKPEKSLLDELKESITKEGPKRGRGRPKRQKTQTSTVILSGSKESFVQSKEVSTGSCAETVKARRGRPKKSLSSSSQTLKRKSTCRGTIQSLVIDKLRKDDQIQNQSKLEEERVTGKPWAEVQEEFFPEWIYDKMGSGCHTDFLLHRPGLEDKSYRDITEDETLYHGVDYFFHMDEMKEYARIHHNWIDPHRRITSPRRARKRRLIDDRCTKEKRKQRILTASSVQFSNVSEKEKVKRKKNVVFVTIANNVDGSFSV